MTTIVAGRVEFTSSRRRVGVLIHVRNHEVNPRNEGDAQVHVREGPNGQPIIVGTDSRSEAEEVLGLRAEEMESNIRKHGHARPDELERRDRR